MGSVWRAGKGRGGGRRRRRRSFPCAVAHSLAGTGTRQRGGRGGGRGGEGGGKGGPGAERGGMATAEYWATSASSASSTVELADRPPPRGRGPRGTRRGTGERQPHVCAHPAQCGWRGWRRTGARGWAPPALVLAEGGGEGGRRDGRSTVPCRGASAGRGRRERGAGAWARRRSPPRATRHGNGARWGGGGGVGASSGCGEAAACPHRPVWVGGGGPTAGAAASPWARCSGPLWGIGGPPGRPYTPVHSRGGRGRELREMQRGRRSRPNG